jgi:hypothetical protein
VKLVDVLRDVIPDFAEVMDNMNRSVLSAMSSAVAARVNDAPANRVRVATLAYARFLGERLGIDVVEADLEIAGLLKTPTTDSGASVRDWRELLAPITAFMEARAGETIAPEVASDYRMAAISEAGLLDPPEPVPFAPAASVADERFLDSELVAVYW